MRFIFTARTDCRERVRLRHGISLFFPQLPQILEESRNFGKRSRRRMAGGCGCMVASGAFASHDPDQHTLQARSASRIEDGLVEKKKKKQQSDRVRKRHQRRGPSRWILRATEGGSCDRRIHEIASMSCNMNRLRCRIARGCADSM